MGQRRYLSQHIVDVPEDLLGYFKSGGFVMSTTGNTLHSVALDECHEMLINKHVKQSIVCPTKDYIFHACNQLLSSTHLH